MPLSINVGLSRKASKDYQSTGVSINVTAELDQSLLAKPAKPHDLHEVPIPQPMPGAGRRVTRCKPLSTAARNRMPGNVNQPTCSTR